MKMKKATILLFVFSCISSYSQSTRFASGLSVSAGRQGLTYLAGTQYNFSYFRHLEHHTPVYTYNIGLSYFNKFVDVYSLENNLEWQVDELEFGWKPGGLWYNGHYFIPVIRLESSYLSDFKRSLFEVNPAIGLSFEYFLQVRFSYLFNGIQEDDILPGKYRISISFSPYLMGKFFHNKEWLKGD
jgi:hypothetical protein